MSDDVQVKAVSTMTIQKTTRVTTTEYEATYTPKELLSLLGIEQWAHPGLTMVHRLGGSPSNHPEETLLDLHNSKFVLRWKTVHTEVI